jgi:hypothetical protein
MHNEYECFSNTLKKPSVALFTAAASYGLNTIKGCTGEDITLSCGVHENQDGHEWGTEVRWFGETSILLSYVIPINRLFKYDGYEPQHEFNNKTYQLTIKNVAGHLLSYSCQAPDIEFTTISMIALGKHIIMYTSLLLLFNSFQ